MRTKPLKKRSQFPEGREGTLCETKPILDSPGGARGQLCKTNPISGWTGLGQGLRGGRCTRAINRAKRTQFVGCGNGR
jgi:hypothetical protein